MKTVRANKQERGSSEHRQKKPNPREFPEKEAAAAHARCTAPQLRFSSPKERAIFTAGVVDYPQQRIRGASVVQPGSRTSRDTRYLLFRLRGERGGELRSSKANILEIKLHGPRSRLRLNELARKSLYRPRDRAFSAKRAFTSACHVNGMGLRVSPCARRNSQISYDSPSLCKWEY